MTTTPRLFPILQGLLCFVLIGRAQALDSDYRPLIEQLDQRIRFELTDKQLPSLVIVLVDKGQTIWRQAYGMADAARTVPATTRTRYRVGSVSKLLTDIAVMRLVEEGTLDLDAPVSKYVPEFRPNNPFNTPITLRQLMTHRSGLVRESPVGNYFDESDPGLERTVRSLNETTLVYEPETRIKYSNAGIAVVGYVLQKTLGMPFEQLIEQIALRPLGMENATFQPASSSLAGALMWTYDGREFPAPTFQLGTGPAGNLAANISDLGHFLEAITSESKPVLKPETWRSMWQPQFEDGPSGFGLGFRISTLDDQLRVSHGGAVYGYSTDFAALPDERLGAALITSRDVSNAVLTSISEQALRGMLRIRAGGRPETWQAPTKLSEPLLAKLAGTYRLGSDLVELQRRGPELHLTQGTYRAKLRKMGDRIATSDRHTGGVELSLDGDAVSINGKPAARLESAPETAPEKLRQYLGEYGWDHNTLYVLERAGKLYALIEWFFYYPLEEEARDVFAFPDYGLYHGESLKFHRDDSGRLTGVVAAEVLFPRRSTIESGKTFRIVPGRPIDKIRAEALSAEPPEQRPSKEAPDLVELIELDRSIQLDIRYASTNNFLSSVLYRQPKAFLQRPAAEALIRVREKLEPLGYGLLVYDAYRPWFVTKMFWDATPEHQKIFVANPENGSRHNRGCAVDLNLFDIEAMQPVEMVGGYDEFTHRSYPDYPGGTSRQRWHRELLRRVMESESFSIYEYEWWHFDYKTWRDYPIQNLEFDRIRG